VVTGGTGTIEVVLFSGEEGQDQYSWTFEFIESGNYTMQLQADDGKFETKNYTEIDWNVRNFGFD
jgi:hypothetical protein